MNIVAIAGSTIPSDTANSIQVMKACNALVQIGHNVTLLVPENRESEIVNRQSSIVNLKSSINPAQLPQFADGFLERARSDRSQQMIPSVRELAVGEHGVQP